MKKLLFIILLALPFFGNAQIIYSDGKLGVNDTTMNSTFPWTIKNWSGLDWYNGPLNYLRIDLSKMGDLRISGSGNKISFPNRSSQGYNQLTAGKIYEYADNLNQTGTTPISSALDKILKLRPINYIGSRVASSEQTVDLNNETTSDDSFVPNEDTFGFVGFEAPNLQGILPKIVRSNNSGEQFINYSGMLPYLVKAIQELSQIVEEQGVQISALTSGKSVQSVRSRINARIAQCSPNPTPGLISIYLEIDDTANSAELRVSSVTGNVEMSQNITPDEKYVDMDLSHLTSGVHVLSLYVDGILADSTQIVKE